MAIACRSRPLAMATACHRSPVATATAGKHGVTTAGPVSPAPREPKMRVRASRWSIAARRAAARAERTADDSEIELQLYPELAGIDREAVLAVVRVLQHASQVLAELAGERDVEFLAE